jgi:hypothetical protein
MKLFLKRCVILSDNIDVGSGVAKMELCVNSKTLFSRRESHRVVIDDFYVWKISIPQIESLKLRFLDGLQDDDEIKYFYLKSV